MKSESPNPFEPPSAIPLDPTTAIPIETHQAQREQTLRVRYVVFMWVFGVLGFIGIPSCSIMFSFPGQYSFEWWDICVGHAVDGRIDWTIHIHLLIVLTFGVASVIASICLFRLPRLSDKIGAMAVIALVGMPPIISAIGWWWELFMEWIPSFSSGAARIPN
jgi:hypothetical protein